MREIEVMEEVCKLLGEFAQEHLPKPELADLLQTQRMHEYNLLMRLSEDLLEWGKERFE